MIQCDKCGRTNSDSYRFCMGCGSKLARAEPAPVASAPAHVQPPVMERPAVDLSQTSPNPAPLDTQQTLDDFYDAMGRLHAATLKLRHASMDPETQNIIERALAEHMRWFASINTGNH